MTSSVIERIEVDFTKSCMNSFDHMALELIASNASDKKLERKVLNSTFNNEELSKPDFRFP